GVDVPGDDPGALTRVGGGDLLADQRVEQRRLPGLHLARDRDPQRLVEALEVVGEPGVGLRAVLVGLDGVAQQDPDGGAERRRGRGHAAPPAVAAGRRSFTSALARCARPSMRASSALRSLIRFSLPEVFCFSALCAAWTDAAIEVLISSARALKWSRSCRWALRNMSVESLPTWNVTSSMCLRTLCFASLRRFCSIRFFSSRTALMPSSTPAGAPAKIGRPASVPSMPNISMPP